MKSYLDLVPISAKVHRKQNRMSIICIVLAVFLVTAIFGMADMFIRGQILQAQQENGNWHIGIQNISDEDAMLISSRPEEKAVAFAEKYGVQNVFTSFEEVCADSAVDIIYISTPHNTHIHFLRKALVAGKHVLCEKSITLNSEELEEAMQLAKEHGVVLAEAMTIYHMPIYALVYEVEDMERAIAGQPEVMKLNYTEDVMYMMTEIRKQWGLTYPEEE